MSQLKKAFLHSDKVESELNIDFPGNQYGMLYSISIQKLPERMKKNQVQSILNVLILLPLVHSDFHKDQNMSKNSYENFAGYLRARGWNSVSITSGLDTTSNIQRGTNMFKDFSKMSIQANCLHFNHNFSVTDKEETVIFLVDNEEQTKIAITYFEGTPWKERVIFPHKNLDKRDVVKYVRNDNMKLDMVEQQNNGSLLISTLIMTARFENPVINERIFSSFSGPEEEPIFDLNGEMLTGITIAFPPYFITKDCKHTDNKKRLHCEVVSGFLIALEKQLSKALNFSFDNIMEPNNNWGFQPLNGDFKTGRFEGVMGGLTENEHDLSLSTWLWIQKRDYQFDFVPMFLGPLVLALTPQDLEVHTYFALLFCLFTVLIMPIK